MQKARVHFVLIAVAFFGACRVDLSAQAVHEIPAPAEVQGKEVRPALRPAPFTADGPMDDKARAIEIRSVSQMTEQDRLQASNAESSIGERAGFVDLDFNQGKWSYEQIVCPAFPTHIFLRFLRNNGTGDVSEFTASIPRGGDGRVRIIPIQRRGYSLFSPAPINALTISAFNHIRGEENPDKTRVRDWVGTGLCYAALAGGTPRLGAPSDDPEKEKYPLSDAAHLELTDGGAAVISFPDAAAMPQPMEWTMSFDVKGKLLKASRSIAPLVSGNLYVHPLTPEQTSKPEPVKAPVLTTRPIAPPAALTEHPVPSNPVVEKPNPIPPTSVGEPAAPASPSSGLARPRVFRLSGSADDGPRLLASLVQPESLTREQEEIAARVHPIPLWDGEKNAVHEISPAVQEKAKLLLVERSDSGLN